MKTPLYDRHLALGAKMVNFADWEMPIQYTSILQETQFVRDDVGIFDVSHMGRISITGPDAEAFLDFLSTNTISGKKEHTATYTVWCHPDGGSVDDVIVYKRTAQDFFVIVNASNRLKDLTHLLDYSRKFDVSVEDHFQDEGVIAVQGPKALAIVQKQLPEATNLKPMHFIDLENGILSGTGYTGAGGCEIYAPNSVIQNLWDSFIHEGAHPIGLGARDTLRLEKGFALYGHEINDTIAPTESIAAWTVKFNKEFVGKEALLALESSSQKRSEYGILLHEGGIAREGYEVYQGEEKIGIVTSGTYSPHLNKGIGIVLAKKELLIGTEAEVKIRNKMTKCKVVKLPFI